MNGPSHREIALLRKGLRPATFALASTHLDVSADRRPFVDLRGLPLPPNTAVELGHFSKATMQRPFAGAWVPLIGPRALKPNRSIPLIRISRDGERPGCFRWCRTFFDAIEERPPNGVPVAFRIFDGPDPATARLSNTVSHASWWFRAPQGPEPAYMELVIDDSTLWESGPAGAFRAGLPNRSVLRLLGLSRHQA